MHEIEFVCTVPESKRHHVLCPGDVRCLLNRLSPSLYERLRQVRFDDLSLGLRRLGYISADRRTIAICAIPSRFDLSPYLEGRSPRLFGALPGTTWPVVAVKRFLLYDVFLQLLGHAQLVNPAAAGYLKFAGPGEARKLASAWRCRLWKSSCSFDPIHCPPSSAELAAIDEELPQERELISL